jgi:hypothetical protein
MKIGKCAVCNSGSFLIDRPSDLGVRLPFKRIYLGTQDPTDADVLPLTVNFKDGSSAHFSINALAQKATTEVENMSSALEIHLGALQMRVPGSPRGLQLSCSSFETVINKLRALVNEIKANQVEGLMTVRLLNLDHLTKPAKVGYLHHNRRPCLASMRRLLVCKTFAKI